MSDVSRNAYDRFDPEYNPVSGRTLDPKTRTVGKPRKRPAGKGGSKPRVPYSQPVCRVCGSHTVALYADYGIRQTGKDGMAVIAFCVPCSQRAFNTLSPEADLYDTVDRHVYVDGTWQRML